MNKAKPLRLKPTPGRSVHDDPVLDRNGTYDGLIYTHGPIEQQIAYHNSQIQNFLSKCAKYASEGKPSMSSLLLLRDNILGLEKTIDVIIKLGMKTYINYEDVVEEYHKLQEALESKEQVPTQEEMASLIERNDPMVLSLPKLNSWKDLSIQIVEHEHVKLAIKGHKTKRVHYSALGFEDNRRSSANEAWGLLLLLGNVSGTLELPYAGLNKVQKKISRLRNSLKQLFGLETNPIPSTGTRKYECAFRIGDNRPEASVYIEDEWDIDINSASS